MVSTSLISTSADEQGDPLPTKTDFFNLPRLLVIPDPYDIGYILITTYTAHHFIQVYHLTNLKKFE